MRLRYALAIVAAVAALPAFGFQKDTARPKPERKSQAEVASKATFTTIPASSPELKKALEAHDIAAARKLVGKPGAFHGTVAKVFTPKSNSVVILNFDPDFKKALVAVVKPEDFARFPRLDSLKDKRVLVTGTFIDYNGTPELSLTNASQVKIIK